MEIENFIEGSSRDALRTWLIENAQKEKCCWIVVNISQKDNTLLYLDAVEEALCFGWIDGIKKKNNKGELMQRLSPRKKNSNWTELNYQRVKRLDKIGLMTKMGYEVSPDLKKDNLIIDKYILDKIKEDSDVLFNYNNFPDLYKRIRIDTIQQVRGDATYERRLEKFLENTKINKMYGKWNDDGRLI